MSLDSAGRVGADATLQVCSVTSFSSLSNKEHVFQSLLHWPSVRKKINTISVALLGKVFPLEFTCACRRSYHSLCCSSDTARSPLFQCMHPWADMDAPFSFTEVNISRRAKGNSALHINTWGKCDTLTNSVLLHQCKIQIKMSNRCLLDWEQQVYSYTEITCSGVRHHQSFTAKTLNIHIIAGDEKIGKLNDTVNWAATNMVTKTHATQSLWVGATAWKRLKTPCLPQPAFSPCVEGAALLVDLQRWVVMLSLFSKEILAPGRQRCLALHHPRLPRACEAVERYSPSTLLKRSSHGELLVPCLSTAAPSRAEVPLNALTSTPAASLVPLLGSSLIGSLPSARVLFQSDRGFPWGEWSEVWGGQRGKEGGKESTIPSQKLSQWSCDYYLNLTIFRNIFLPRTASWSQILCPDCTQKFSS